MIDTDKYEGHIQGEWRDTIHEGALAHHIYAGDTRICTVEPNEATANLVTDAPLILQALIDERAEVKRLREEITALNKWADNVREFFGDEAMMDLYDIYGGEEE